MKPKVCNGRGGGVAAACDLPAMSRRELLRNAAVVAGGMQAGQFGINAVAQGPDGLAAAWEDAFLVGVAVSNGTIDRRIPEHLDLIAREFNSVTAENAMKWGVIRPDGVNWQWERADALAEFAGEHDMHVLGHTLVWHSQVPRSIFQEPDGTARGRGRMLGVMEDHINEIVGRYQGRIHAWDVVNEAVDEGNGWRRSQWLSTVGDDFMEQAFRLAHAADPNAKLLYNDYNMHNPDKRAFLVDVIRDYLDRGVPIHGIGLQSHVGLTYPDMEEWERSIATYAEMGLEVHITELEVDVLPSPYEQSAEISNRFEYSAENDPWPDGLPDEIEEQLADRYEQVFRTLLRYRDSVARVTLWGLHDGISWKNNFPISGRTNYPLLFDRNLEARPAYNRLLDLARDEV